MNKNSDFPIKKYIDSNRKPGIYILTGSANPLLINKVAESLVGRLETLTLYPLSQGELHDRKEDFITTAFNTEQLLLPENTISKEELYKRMIVGGYPLVQPLSASRGDAWFRGYVRDILIKDVQDLSNIEGLSELPNLLKLISYRAGHVLNVAELSRQFGLSAVTTHRYLALLEALFMVYFCKPWRASAEKRLVKSPKVYMIDSGMVSFLQGMTVERLLAEPLFTGHILENFVWQELTKQATWSNLYVDIYHFRTDTGVEVDIVLEDMMGRVVGIKLKNSDTVKGHDFKGLEYLQEKFGNKFVRGIIFYTGNDFVPFSKKLNALPFSSLWR